MQGRHYVVVDSFALEMCFCPSSELSHSILAMAISQVSRTVLSESVRNSLRIEMDNGSDIAPIASAAYVMMSEVISIWKHKPLLHAEP